jgi:hypothetical protein
VNIDRAMRFKSDHHLADFLPEPKDKHQVRSQGGHPLHHIRRIDVFGLDTGDRVLVAPEIDIGMMGLAAVAAGRSRRLGKHTSQFMAAVMNGLQTWNAELC